MSPSMFRTARAGRVLLVAAVVLAAGAAFVDPHSSGAAASTSTSAVTVTKTVTRIHEVTATDGTTSDDQVDSRTVSLTVSQTAGLRSQRIQVSWTGAHPTGGIVADPASSDARYQEYPLVLLQCRGDASTVTPETCWTFSPSERFEDDRNLTFPPYRLDRYASAADRGLLVNSPDCSPPDDSYVQHYVPFVAADGTSYPGLCNTPAEQSTSNVAPQPDSPTFGVTGTDGTGSALFNVQTVQDNASLGCDTSTTCSLVAIPIMGISCDTAAHGLPADDVPQAGDDTSGCAKTGQNPPGGIMPNSPRYDLAVTGSLWWSASNWRNRIVVPLGFAPLPTVCDNAANSNELDVLGSELMTQATQQWTPALCGGTSGFTLRHLQAEEPQARLAVGDGEIPAAFTVNSEPDDYQQPTVLAPTAVTGFAIGYTIDGADGAPFTDLKLTPRLLAKLLTESYPTSTDFAIADPAIADGNPLSLFTDPEFLALNPALAQVPLIQRNNYASAASAIFLSSNSDIMRALTAYIWADPEARQWLTGAPDPWGMTVNGNYSAAIANGSLTLPTDSWPELDATDPAQSLLNNDACLNALPVPYLPLVASPTSRLSTITRDLELAQPTTTLTCTDPDSPQQHETPGDRQPVGQRFLLGITSLADTHRYLLDTAALESHDQGGTRTPANDADGRTFVSATDAALQAAADLATPDDAQGVWALNYDTLRSPAGVDAYPGTLIVSTAVPVSDLAPDDAADAAAFLRFTAGPGQTPGLDAGQLPPGYLPLTAANGLGALADYTLRAAAAVAGQTGQTPPFVPSPVTSTTPTPHKTTSAATTHGSGSAAQTSSAAVTPAASAIAATAALPSLKASPQVASPLPAEAAQAVALATTAGSSSGLLRLLAPAMLALAVLAAVGGTVLLVPRRRR